MTVQDSMCKMSGSNYKSKKTINLPYREGEIAVD